MRLGRRTGLALASAAVLVGAVTAATTTTTPASAASGNQWCNTDGYCTNAWSGGPFVKSFSYSARNNDFDWVGNYSACNGGITTSTCPGHGIPAGYGIGAIKFTGSGSWVGQCIGDAYNDSGHADSSLDPCPGGGNGNGGWGTNFVYLAYPGNTCGSGYALLYNIRWNGYLRIPDNNGSTIYLNNSVGSCIHLLPYN